MAGRRCSPQSRNQLKKRVGVIGVFNLRVWKDGDSDDRYVTRRCLASLNFVFNMRWLNKLGSLGKRLAVALVGSSVG